MDQRELLIEKHSKYFLHFLRMLPSRMGRHDSSRILITFYSVCGLDVLDRLHLLDLKFKEQMINWIYRCQYVPHPNDTLCGGFQGSTTFITKELQKSMINNSDSDPILKTKNYKWGHLAMTYAAISALVTLGDDLSRLDRNAIIRGVEAVQQPDGSFSAAVEGTECDMRFIFCASAICAILNDWGNVNKEKMAEYILNSIRYDYGFSQEYEMEGHGGTTFCALAALSLSDQLNLLHEEQIEGVKRWLILRQTAGFEGRPNKTQDTCYSFWIGASLKILNSFHLTNYEKNREYILSTQDNVVGGFSKWPDSNTDPFHTYFGLCGLSFIGDHNILEIVPTLNITKRAYEHLNKLQKEWEIK